MSSRTLTSIIRPALAATALLGAAAVSAQTTAEPSTQQTAGEEPSASQETDMVFRYGENLLVSEATTDDLFAAGNTVSADGASADHLILAGGEVVVRDAAPKDLFAAGGELKLDRAEIADDLVAAGGDLVAGPALTIGGSAVIAAGTVRFESPVGGDLRIGAGEIFVNSTIAGDARLSGDRVVLGPKARIGGDLYYRTDELVIEPGAVVEGTQTKLTTPDYARPEDAGHEFGRFMLFAGLSFLLSYAVIVLALVLGLPQLMRSTSMEMQERPWRSLGIGGLFVLVVPMLVIALAMSAIGLPLAILVIAICVALTPIAFAVTGYTAGTILRGLVTKRSDPPENLGPRILWPLLGVAVLFALTLIPMMGIAVWFVAMLFGLGALLQRAVGALSSPADTVAARAQPAPV